MQACLCLAVWAGCTTSEFINKHVDHVDGSIINLGTTRTYFFIITINEGMSTDSYESSFET